MSDFVAKKNKMRGPLASKCQQSSGQPAQEEDSNPIEIKDDENDEEETTGHLIPSKLATDQGLQSRIIIANSQSKAQTSASLKVDSLPRT